jgi:hypothetical protein
MLTFDKLYDDLKLRQEKKKHFVLQRKIFKFYLQ